MRILHVAAPNFRVTLLMLFLAFLLPVAQGQGQPVTAKAPGNFLDVQGSKIYYEECGAGAEAVILIHDGIADSLVWDGVWPAFCKQFHTIRYDRRGYGRSPATTVIYTETDDLFALLRHLRDPARHARWQLPWRRPGH